MVPSPVPSAEFVRICDGREAAAAGASRAAGLTTDSGAANAAGTVSNDRDRAKRKRRRPIDDNGSGGGPAFSAAEPTVGVSTRARRDIGAVAGAAGAAGGGRGDGQVASG